MKKQKIMIAAVVLLLVFMVGGAIAYFTDKDEVTNTFTIGNVDITLTEPSWVAENGQNIVPGKPIAKDPTVTVASTSQDAYVFLKVEVPCKADNSAVLFDYTLNSGWAVVTGQDGACTSGKATKVYGYGSLTALSANGTATLFNNVTLVNLTNAEATALTGNITMPITAYAIQANGLTSSDPATVWALVEQNA